MKSNKTLMRKSRINSSSSKPSPAIRKLIKRTNIVSAKTELDFDDGLDLGFEDFKLYLENSYPFFLKWANIHNLKRYPKLFRYLSWLAKKNKDWKSAFNKIKQARKFLNIFVEIAEFYQKKLERYELEGYKIARTLIHESNDPKFISIVEDLFKNKGFQIPYIKPDALPSISRIVRRDLDPDGQREEDLGKRFFAIAFSDFLLSVDKNHLSRFSFGEFFEVANNVDLRRLKRCSICSNIFWAYRINAIFCSKKCSNSYHQQVLRANEKRREEVNKARKENYHNKKKGIVK